MLKAIEARLQSYFKIKARGSTWLGEVRGGFTLFFCSVYILFLNPLILGGSGFPGSGGNMPPSDVFLATAISTGVGTMTMGGLANLPIVISVQLGTNTYFVNNVLKPSVCFADKVTGIFPSGCKPAPALPLAAGLGTRTLIPYQKALAATFIEGIIFMLIAVTGFRGHIMRMIPASINMSGAAGIGMFIAFVGMKDSGFIVEAGAWDHTLGSGGAQVGAYPTVTALNREFNYCRIKCCEPPFGVSCPWLALGGLIFASILLVAKFNGALICGILFTTFISWIKWNADTIDPKTWEYTNGAVVIMNPALAPAPPFEAPKFAATAGSLDFNWGSDSAKLVEALVTFLYLDFIGSIITFFAMGKILGELTDGKMEDDNALLDERGILQDTNKAFVADATGTIVGSILGTSCLTSYVESASAVADGARTGVSSIICGALFFLAIILNPIVAQAGKIHIPFIATGPILILIGMEIFRDAIGHIDWHDLSEAVPCFITIIVQPYTNNIAYGMIAGWAFYVFSKLLVHALFPAQRRWATYRFVPAEYKTKPTVWELMNGTAEDPMYVKYRTAVPTGKSGKGTVAPEDADSEAGAPGDSASSIAHVPVAGAKSDL